MKLAKVLASEIVVCAGSGGVGKTTVSAAIALEASLRGRSTIVVTIDPARRLANSLGLEQLSNTPKRIPKEKFEAAGLPPCSLDAMMLDTKTTFDELVIRYARSEQKARKIINNRFYQAISGALSGTHEYMAMEKLYELSMEGNYDLIVIDTPPTRNALDFLDAPKRMTSFLEGKLLKWFLLPAIGGGKGLFKIANFAAVSFLKVVQKIVGAQVLSDTAEFFANFEGMYEGFKQRAQAVYELLRKPTTSFVVVTAPTNESVEEALFFAKTLRSYELPFGGLIVNRVLPDPDLPAKVAAKTEAAKAVLGLARRFEQIALKERRSLERLESEVEPELWVQIPYQTEEVVDLKALKNIAELIFGSAGKRPL